VFNVFEQHNILYVGDLVQCSEFMLVKWKKFGRRSLKEVKEALAEMTFHLDMKIDFWKRPQQKE